MVLQGAPGEEKTWAIPSGGIEPGESPADCCLREVWEETGYRVEVLRKIFEKQGQSYGWDVEVHYFAVRIVGGAPCIQDPDGRIHAIDWKSANDIETLALSFPEDREFLLAFVKKG